MSDNDWADFLRAVAKAAPITWQAQMIKEIYSMASGVPGPVLGRPDEDGWMAVRRYV